MAPVKAASEWTGLPQRMVLSAFGILFTMLAAYFVWLGTAVVEVRQKVTAIEASIKSLNETRAVAVTAKSETNSRRLDALEEEGEGTE